MAAKKLDNELLSALANQKYLQFKEDKRLFYKHALYKEGCCAAKTRSIVYICLYCLKKVYKQVYSKELYLIEQGLYELEAKEAKTDSILMGEQVAYTPVVDLLSPLVSSLSKVY